MKLYLVALAVVSIAALLGVAAWLIVKWLTLD